MKKLSLIIIICIDLVIPLCLHAQTERTWEDVLGNIGQEEDVDNGTLELMYDELSEIAANKFDLNTCTREQLEMLPFLSSQQVMDFIEYRDRVRRLESLAELFLVPSIDYQTIGLLRQFATISPKASGDTIPSLRNVLRYGRNTMFADLQVPFYDRAGDRDGYLGYKYKHWLRYTFAYRHQVRFGITAAQDAGEPFFAGKNKTGYDFYSVYFLAKDMGHLKTLALGRYRLRFGMGLILNNSFGFGKLATLSSLASYYTHVYAHSSRSEANYLQGAAATVTLAEGLDLTGFVSYRKIDATLNGDSATVATILKTGYHRTQSEMDRRRNTSQTLAGGNINFFKNGFHAGLTGYYTSYNRDLKMDNGQRYRRWYPAGSSFYNLSVDYGYRSYRLNIMGETAVDNNQQVATINTLSYQFSSRLTLTALQRYYPYRYQALLSQTFAEGGQANDESGVFLGGKWSPWNDAQLSFYTDISYFAWPKYGVSQSSKRWDNFVQLDVEKGNWNFTTRYRMKLKEMDNDTKTALVSRYEHRGRFAATYGTASLVLRSQADVAYTTDEERSFGVMFSESADWQWRWLRARGSVGWFHTDDYNSRVYTHEPGLLYTFSFPSFSGHGMRYAISLRAEVNDNLLLVAKCGTTKYFDRSVISSALQQIDHSSQTDLEVQLRWKFLNTNFKAAKNKQ